MIYNFPQKSPEWYQFRLGKFSASEYHKLFTQSRDKKGFGQVALKYIDLKITDIITNGINLDYGFQGNKATEWGNYWEPIAREKLIEMGFKIEQIGCFGLYDRLISSPDGVNDKGVFEIKCPHEPNNHTDNLFIENQLQLKALRFEYYVQIQVQILGFEINFNRKTDENYFVSFDPRPQNKNLQFSIIPVERDQEMIIEITNLYYKANEILNQKIDYLLTKSKQNENTFYSINPKGS